MNINHERLVPGAITYWGDVVGDITDQQDLVDYISTHGGGGSGDATWGSIQGTLSDQQDLMNEFDKDRKRLNDLEDGIVVPVGTATEQWVQDQGYLVQDDLSQYATRQWVTGRGYATESWVLQDYTNDVLSPACGKAEDHVKDWVVEEGYINQIKTVNNQSLVGTGNVEISGLTPAQEEAISPLVNPESGMLYTVELGSKVSTYLSMPFDHSEYNKRLYNLNGDIYCRNYSELYKLDLDYMKFNLYVRFNGYSDQPMWNDNTGRVYMGNSYEVDMTTGQITSVSLNANGYSVNNNRHNIFKGKYGIYCLSDYSGKFNESTQEFESWSVISSVSNNAEFAKSYVEYDGHIVYVYNGEMHELIEYEDHIEIVQVQVGSEYFPVTINNEYYSSQFLVNVDGDLYYFLTDWDYKLVNGSWEWFQIKDENGDNDDYRHYDTGGIVCGSLLIGFEGNYYSGKYNVINLDSDTLKLTYWTDVKDVCVDIDSNQTIRGGKDFTDYISANGLYIASVNPIGQNTNINLNNTSIGATRMNITVSGASLLNGNSIATTADCIVNKTVIGYGGRTSAPVHQEIGIPERAFHFTTHTGRLFKYDPNQQWWYEFDGSQWNALATNLSVLGSIGLRVVVTENATYLNYSTGYTYLWDDANTDWVQIAYFGGFASDYTYFWPNGDTLRYGDSYKLVENGGTYTWESDPISEWKDGFYAVINSDVYVLCFSDYNVYQWDEQNKSYGTSLGMFPMWTTSRTAYFTACGEIFFIYNADTVMRIDFSKVGVEEYISVDSGVPIFEYNRFAGEYDGYLWYYSEYYDFRYCYDLEEEAPEVPAQDGNYVLKATVLNGDVTYSWVPDNVL